MINTDCAQDSQKKLYNHLFCHGEHANE